MPPSKRSVSVTYIAQSLDVNVRTVRAWIEAGELRALNVAAGRKRPSYRVALGTLERFLIKRGWAVDDVREAFANPS